MVTGLEGRVRPAQPDLPDDPHELVLGAGGGGGIGEVGQRQERRVELLLDCGELLRELLLQRTELALLGDRARGVLAGALGLRDRVGGGVAARAQRLQLGDQRAAALVQLDHAVEAVGDARPQRRASAARTSSGWPA